MSQYFRSTFLSPFWQYEDFLPIFDNVQFKVYCFLLLGVVILKLGIITLVKHDGIGTGPFNDIYIYPCTGLS